MFNKNEKKLRSFYSYQGQNNIMDGKIINVKQFFSKENENKTLECHFVYSIFEFQRLKYKLSEIIG